jgi:hypothetical protein
VGAQGMTAFVPAAGPPVERDIARDLARRAAIVAPVVVLVCGIVWGAGGALGALCALLLVAGNFLVAAALITYAARISLSAVMVAALGGFFVRLAVITAIGIGVKQIAAVDFSVFCITLIVAHLGLLFWETRYISLTLAAPGLTPKKEEG